MTHLHDLLSKSSSRGVEFRLLGEVAFYSDTRIDAGSLDETSFVGVDNLLPNFGGKTDASHSPNTDRVASYKVGDILLGNIRPYLKKIWLADASGGCSGDVLAIRIKEQYRGSLLPEFLYRLLASDAFFDFNMRHAKGAKMPRGSKEKILNYSIPLPPVEVQKAIIATLESFTEFHLDLQANLNNELILRKAQLRYYRDTLLSFSGKGVRAFALGDIGIFTRGRRFTKDDYASEGVPCIHYGDIYTHYGTSATESVCHVRAELSPSLRFAKAGDVVIAAVGETVEDVGKAVAWLGDEQVAIHDDCFTFRHKQNPKFIAYCFQTYAFNAEKNKFVARAKVKRLSSESLAKLTIPIPPLEEQNRIVDILDRLDDLLTSLLVELPAEINARRQQYQHYRDRLLTFKMAA